MRRLRLGVVCALPGLRTFDSRWRKVDDCSYVSMILHSKNRVSKEWSRLKASGGVARLNTYWPSRVIVVGTSDSFCEVSGLIIRDSRTSRPPVAMAQESVSFTSDEATILPQRKVCPEAVLISL